MSLPVSSTRPYPYPSTYIIVPNGYFDVSAAIVPCPAGTPLAVIPICLVFPLFGPSSYTGLPYHVRRHPQHLPHLQYPVTNIARSTGLILSGGLIPAQPDKKVITTNKKNIRKHPFISSDIINIPQNTQENINRYRGLSHYLLTMIPLPQMCVYSLRTLYRQKQFLINFCRSCFLFSSFGLSSQVCAAASGSVSRRKIIL